jgi:hypothetical protein
VQSALNNGAVPYSPPSYMDNDDDEIHVAAGSTTSGFKIAAYATPTMPVTTHNSIMGLSSSPAPAPGDHSHTAPAAGAADHNAPAQTAPAAGNGILAGKGVAQVWGRKTVVEAPPAAAPAPAAAQLSSPGPAPTTTPSTATSPAATSPAPVVPEAPRAPTEKEKMAAALFGGMGSGGGAATTSRRGSAASTRRSSSSGNVNQPATPAAPATPPPAAPATANMFDLLDVAPPVAAPVVQPAAQQPAPDLFGDMLVPTAVALAPAIPTTPPPAPPVPAASIFDAFADMTIESTGDSTSTAAAQARPAYNPIRLTTADFGGRWGQTPSESRRVFRISPKSGSLQGFVTALQEERGISHIESIPTTSEVNNKSIPPFVVTYSLY